MRGQSSTSGHLGQSRQNELLRILTVIKINPRMTRRGAWLTDSRNAGQPSLAPAPRRAGASERERSDLGGNCRSGHRRGCAVLQRPLYTRSRLCGPLERLEECTQAAQAGLADGIQSLTPAAHSVSVPSSRLLSLQLLHDLRHGGAVCARQAP